LTQLLGQLAQANPQLFQLISQNQEAFMKLLMEQGGPVGGGGAGGPPPGSNVVHVTPQEKEAIDRVRGREVNVYVY
jgi:hypothetical protein